MKNIVKKFNLLSNLSNLILGFFYILLIYLSFGWSESSIIQAKSIDEYSFHLAILKMYEGLIFLDLRSLFTFGFYSYGFNFFFLNMLMSYPFLGEYGNNYAYVIPRILNSTFLILSLILILKVIKTEFKKNNLPILFTLLFIISMPGIWTYAVLFRPEYLMTFFLILSILFFAKAEEDFNKNFYLAVVFLGFAVSIKIQALTAGFIVILFFINSYIKYKSFLAITRNGIFTIMILAIVFIVNNPYVINPNGFDAWLYSFEANMLSNETNHGSGNIGYFDRLNDAVFTNFFPISIYILIFISSIFYSFKRLDKKVSTLNYIAIYILSNFIYLLFFVNKGWGHYYLPLIILSPILLIAVIKNLLKITFLRKTESLMYALILIPNLIIFAGENINNIENRINNKIISLDSGLEKYQNLEIIKSNQIKIFFNGIDLDNKIVLASPYINFPKNDLLDNYKNFYTIFNPLSFEVSNSIDKAGKEYDYIFLSKEDIYFKNDSNLSEDILNQYKLSIEMIDTWLIKGSGYYLKKEDNNFYLFEKFN